MKKIIGTMVALTVLAIFISSAQAVIKIEVSEVQNGVAFIKGNGAARGAAITWEGFSVTTANKNNGGFSFFGILPDDCIGELSDGGVPLDVAVLNCTQAAPAPVARTGQTTCYDNVGIGIACVSSGQDGELQKGVGLPAPRFIDNLNGTITDNLTGLIWLKNANCPNSYIIWPTALTYVAELNSTGTMNGISCGDTSVAGNTHQTDWRLPNVRELFSLLNFGFTHPAISNAAGTGNGTISDPFLNFTAVNGRSLTFWSSDSVLWRTNHAHVVDFTDGSVQEQNKNGEPYGVGFSFVIAVRGGS